MKAKRTNKQKIKGDNIINIVDSPGAVVSKNGLLDNLILAMQGKPVNTIQPLSIIKRVLDSYHPYYKFVPDFSGEGMPSIGIVAKSSDALEKCPLKGTMSVQIPDKYKKFGSMNELLKHSYLTQEPIIFDEVNSFKTLMGNQILDEFNSNNATDMSITLVPQPFPPPRPFRISIKGTALAYNYIELGLDKIDKGIWYLSNDKQDDAQVRFNISLDVENKCGQYSLSIDDRIKVTATKVLKMQEFLYAVSKGNAIDATDIKSDGVLFNGSATLNIESLKNIEKMVEFYRKIVEIEECFKVEFELPEYINEDYAEKVEYIYEIISKGEYEGYSDKYTLTINSKEGLEAILNLVQEKDDKSAQLMILFKDVEEELFGNKLCLGHLKYYLPKSRLESIEELESKIKFYREGNSVEVYLVADKDEKYKQVFEKFKKT